MRLFHLLCIILIALIINGCQTVTYNGETHLKDKSYENLTINGHATLDKISVENMAKFSSSIEAKRSTFNQVDSVANIKCDDCVINNLKAASINFDQGSIGNAVIKNNVNISNASVKELTFSGTEAEFKNSKIGSIKNTGYTKKRVIILIDSEVSGDVSFESTEPCKVLLKGNSTIQGKIINGEAKN